MVDNFNTEGYLNSYGVKYEVYPKISPAATKNDSASVVNAKLKFRAIYLTTLL